MLAFSGAFLGRNHLWNMKMFFLVKLSFFRLNFHCFPLFVYSAIESNANLYFCYSGTKATKLYTNVCRREKSETKKYIGQKCVKLSAGKWNTLNKCSTIARKRNKVLTKINLKIPEKNTTLHKKMVIDTRRKTHWHSREHTDTITEKQKTTMFYTTISCYTHLDNR